LNEPTELRISGKLSDTRSQKRKEPSGRESQELTSSAAQSVTTSKRKAKASAKSKFANDQHHGIEMIEEDSQSDIDEEEIERIVKQVQEERFFRKEFEKDLKKFAKLKAETDMNEEPMII
jgi:cytidylate kinase